MKNKKTEIPKAEILIGYRTEDYSGDSLCTAAPQYVFTLYLNGKFVTSPKICNASGDGWDNWGERKSSEEVYNSNWYGYSLDNRPTGFLRACLEVCKDTAREFAERLRKRKVRQYNLVNGQRMRHTTLERVFCEKLPKEAVQTFRRTLNSKLKGGKK